MKTELPFKRRLFLLIAGVTGGSLLLFFLLLGMGLFFFLHEEMLEDIDTVSELLTEQAMAEIRYSRSGQILANVYAGLKNQPSIETAVFYAANNRPLFHYVKPGLSPETVLMNNYAESGERFLFQDGKIKLQMVRPVGYGEERPGRLLLVLQTASLAGRFGSLLSLLLFGFAVCLGLALSAAPLLQKQFSLPLLSLSEKLAKIARRREYSRRLQAGSSDELAELTERINVLLERLHLRERQLQGHDRNLEALVEQRTQAIRRQYEQIDSAAKKGDPPATGQAAGEVISHLWPEKGLNSESSAADGEELWNLVRALELVGGDEQLFYELATAFLDRNDQLLQNIATAVEHGDADDLLESAHTYKGVIGYFASPVLRRSAKVLEDMARGGRTDGVDIHLARLQEKSRLLCRELAQLIIEAKGS